MNGFWIYAIILTIGLFIYYAVVIMKDMYGKKEETVSDEEDIDVPVTEEKPTVILEETPLQEEEEETADETQHETQISDSDIKDEGTSSTEQKPYESEVVVYDPEHPEGISSKEKLRRAELGFEEVDSESSGEINEVDFRDMLKKCTPSHPNVKVKYDRI